MRALALVAAVSVLAACGSSSSAPAAAPPPSPEPNGNPTTTQPTPPPPSQPGTPAPPPQPGTPTPPDRFATIERLDPGPSCDPLVPSSVPEPVTFQANPQPSGVEQRACGQALSDGRGDVAAAVISHFSNGNDALTWQAFTRDGAAGELMTRSADDPIVALPEGWQGPQGRPGAIQDASVVTWFGNGARRNTTPGTPTSGFTERFFFLAPDPAGGSLLVQTGAPDQGSANCGDARRIGPTGDARPAAPLGCDPFVTAAVSNAGESLVLTRASQDLTLRWIGADGQPQPVATEAGGAAFLAGDGPSRLYPLLDGGLVLQNGTFWSRSYAHLADHGDAAPPWLQSRPGTRFRFTRGNRGYAVFPPPDQVSSDCSQVVEIVSPEGRSCARIIFHDPGAPDCKTGFVDQGWDGTVVRQAASGTCTWRAWPGFLAGP